MSTQSDRRAPNGNRIPFDAMVEVGGELGPSFEAQAVNLSEEGMHLRTAYLPEVGQSMSCRFDAGEAGRVEAHGVVIWKEEMGRVGEFGVRFTNLDTDSVTLDTPPAPANLVGGTLRWLDGPHAGSTMAIVAATAGGLILDAPLRTSLTAGLRALVREGCDHTLDTCATRFANAANFQGEPFLPGNDQIYRYPPPPQ